MIFPRETFKVGSCIAFIYKREHSNPLGHYRGIKFKGKVWGAHRLSYCLNCQPIPRLPPAISTDMVLHTCDNKWCINPKHLYLGNRSSNTQDVWDRSHPSKIRRRKQALKIHIANHNSKLSKATRIMAGRKAWKTRKMRYGPQGSLNPFGRLLSEATKRKISETKKRQHAESLLSSRRERQ